MTARAVAPHALSCGALAQHCASSPLPILDFRCRSLVPTQYAYESYHRVHDCLLPQLPTVRLVAAYTGAAPLAQHAAPIVGRLADSDLRVREAAVATLGKLDAASLAQHAAPIVGRLEDSDGEVRQAAVATLGKLDAASLAQHSEKLEKIRSTG